MCQSFGAKKKKKKKEITIKYCYILISVLFSFFFSFSLLTRVHCVFFFFFPFLFPKVFTMWMYFLVDCLSRSTAMAIVFDLIFSIDFWYAYMTGFVVFWFVFDICIQSCINRGGEDQMCNDTCPQVSPLSAAMSVFSSFPLSTKRKDRRRLFYISTVLTLGVSLYLVGPAISRHGAGECGLLDMDGPYWTGYDYKVEYIKTVEAGGRRQRRTLEEEAENEGSTRNNIFEVDTSQQRRSLKLFGLFDDDDNGWFDDDDDDYSYRPPSPPYRSPPPPYRSPPPPYRPPSPPPRTYDGGSCSSSSSCSSGVCRGNNCCNAKGRSTGCLDCDSDGDCGQCDTGYTKRNYECFASSASSDTGCESGYFTCTNNNCVPRNYVCDGDNVSSFTL